MNKRMRELLAEIQTKAEDAKQYINKDTEQFDAIMKEVDALEKEYDLEKKLFEMNKGMEVTPMPQNIEEKFTSEQILAKEVRAIMNPSRFAMDKGLNETVDAEGGYTVPEDIETQVRQWRDVEFALASLIAQENVSTIKGQRTYQTRGTAQGFVDYDENEAIDNEIEAPQFERITYQIKNRAGFMPVSNDLIADSDANIMGIMTEWLRKADMNTANAHVMQIIRAHVNKGETTASVRELANLDALKEVINVDLGQIYKGTSMIITNDEGLNYLDTLKDTNGRYLLTPDINATGQVRFSCGALSVPVRVIPSQVLANFTEGSDEFIPIIVGDLKEGIRRYVRQGMSLMASNTASIGSFNAFAMNMTLIRAILRDDYKEIDANAYYVCGIKK